jgi:hypothetical protein
LGELEAFPECSPIGGSFHNGFHMSWLVEPVKACAQAGRGGGEKGNSKEHDSHGGPYA